MCRWWHAGSAEFAGLSAIASAFYLDFDSPTIQNMPDVIREQRAAVEDSWNGPSRTSSRINGGARPWATTSREPVLDECWPTGRRLLLRRDSWRAAVDGRARRTMRGVYRLYRTFGGEDMEASHARAIIATRFNTRRSLPSKAH